MNFENSIYQNLWEFNNYIQYDIKEPILYYIQNFYNINILIYY